jgi:L-arabinose isomerase
MHPLVGNLSTVKDTELENTINELTRKYFMARDSSVQQQIAMVLDTYKAELGERRRREYEKMMSSRDKGLDKLINVS